VSREGPDPAATPADDRRFVYVYDGTFLDPRIRALDDHAGAAWHVLILMTARHGPVIPFDDAVDQLSQFRDYDKDRIGLILAALENAELVHLHDDGAIEMLARGDLWAMEHDVE
jgi:hypothetical protein